MVQHSTADSLSATFAPLADTPRRPMRARRGCGGRSVTALAGAFDSSMPARPGHLRVRERAGLIARSREAQWRPCRPQPAPLKEVADWAEHYRAMWEQRFDRLDTYLNQLQKKETSHGRKRRR